MTGRLNVKRTRESHEKENYQSECGRTKAKIIAIENVMKPLFGDEKLTAYLWSDRSLWSAGRLFVGSDQREKER